SAPSASPAAERWRRRVRTAEASWCGGRGAVPDDERRMDLLIDELSSPLGTIVIAACEGRLCGLDFGESRPRMLADLSARFDGPRVKAAPDPFGIGRRVRPDLAGGLAGID